MVSRYRSERGNVASIVSAAVLAALLIGFFALHFTQKRHNRLPFDIDHAYPPDKPIVNGEVLATAMAAIMDHELSSWSGWRPNDFFLWGPGLGPDNNANRQLGIIQAMRESVRVFSQHLTKISATEYDPNLVVADTAFRNDAQKFWLPSAESKFNEGVRALRQYIAGLKKTPPTSKPINRRNIELIRLFQTWSDQLGDAHGALFKEHEPDGSAVRFWKTDDYFYHAQGMAYVMYHLTRAIHREYEIDLVNRPTVASLLDDVADALGHAAVLKPVVVFNGSASGLLANHRRNLDVYIAEARQKMYSIREELEK